MDRKEQIKQAKEWYYTTHEKPGFFSRLYWRLKNRIAAWACNCDTFRGDEAIRLAWLINGPGKDE